MDSRSSDLQQTASTGRVREAFIAYTGAHSECELKEAVLAFTDEHRIAKATPERIIVELKRLADSARDALAKRGEYSHDRARTITEALGRATTWCVDRYYANPK